MSLVSLSDGLAVCESNKVRTYGPKTTAKRWSATDVLRNGKVYNARSSSNLCDFSRCTVYKQSFELKQLPGNKPVLSDASRTGLTAIASISFRVLLSFSLRRTAAQVQLL